jgi:hypothetical protein
MRKPKDIKLVVHGPRPENAEKFATVLSKEYVRLIEALLTMPKDKHPSH